MFDNLGFRKRRETEEGASRLDGFDYSARIVPAENESASLSILLHGPPQRCLCVAGHIVSLIQNENLERNLAQRRHPCKFFHSRTDNINSSLITRVQLHEHVLESLSEQIMCKAERSGRLPSSRWSGEQAVRHRSSLDKLFETRNDLFLIYNLVQSLRPIFLSPESSFQQGQHERFLV